jgi:hypothetical protein
MNNISFHIKNNTLKSGFVKNILLFFAFLIIAALVSTAFLFFKFKSIYVNVSSGQQDLGYSLQLAAKGDFSNAQVAAQRASNNFLVASEIVADLQDNFIVKKINFLNENLNDFKKLAQIAEVLSRSANKALFLVQDIDEVFSGEKSGNFLELSEEERLRVLKVLYESYPEMQGIKANINLALLYLDQIRENRFLIPYINQVDSLGANLEKISLALEKTISLASIIPVLAGYPESSTYLIVLQNNNELRPTGGFIGSYGVLELRAGNIYRLETHDSYHLDMPASLNSSFRVEPPEPMKKYLGVDRWFLRDANWSPDWPSSAQNLQWFYREELLAANRSNELINFSGVIAIIPEFVTDLLYVVGPVEIDGQVYDSNNFVETLQYEVEMAFREEGISEWDRKSVIGDILQELTGKLFSLSSDRWPELMDIFNKNIKQKNILVYLNDDYSRQVSVGLNWGGEIKDSQYDYLMVVDANLAAFKTDRVMDKKIKYYLKQEGQKFRARLEVTYKNDGWFDWQTTRYRTFTRIYVPKNSALLSSSGSLEVSSSYVEDNILNPKTYFTSFLSVEPGDTKALVFEYYLPDEISEKIIKNNSYSLMIQKQPGNNISEFEAHIEFSKPISSFLGEGELEISDNNVYWSNSLEGDYFLEIKL